MSRLFHLYDMADFQREQALIWVPSDCMWHTDEYPQMVNIHTRCISMLAHLWHAHDSKNAMGTATTGSSEAIMLGGLALKKRWQAKMKAAGKDIHNPGPNIVMGG